MIDQNYISILARGLKMAYRSGRLGPSIDELNAFSNRSVKCGIPAPWEKDSNYNSITLTESATAKLEKLRTTSFLVIKDEKILFEKYWKPFAKNTPINSFSIAKSIVCALVGIAVREGYLKLDDPVGLYLDAFRKNKKELITIEHLLRMCSGLEWIESEGNPISHNAQAYYGTDLEKLIIGLNVSRPPGEVYRYVSGNTQILAMVITKVSDMTLSDFAAKKLWKKIGAEKDAHWNLDRKNGVEKAFCCFYATPSDFARLGQLYLNKGKWGDLQIIPEQFIDQCLEPDHRHDIWINKPNTHYGMHWWLVNHLGYKFFYARGIRGQYIICNKKLRLVVVRMGHKRNPVDRHNGHPPDLFDHINAAMEIITPVTAIAPDQ